MEYAKKLLLDNGWTDTDGDGIVEKDGLKAEFKCVYPSGDSVRQAVGMAVAEQLLDIGIKVDIEGMSWDEIMKVMFSEAVLMGWGSSSPNETYYLYRSEGALLDDFYNPEGYQNDITDAYLDAARRSIDYFINKNYVVYRDHWLAYAMNEFTRFVHEEKYYTFALRNAWENRERIRKQQTSYHTYLELLMETYDIYLRIKEQNISVDYMNQIDEDEFVEIIKYRAFHMLDGYFYPEYAMYMERPDKILGSFFVRHDDFRARIDDNQHFIDGYAKYYKLILHNGE